MFIFYYINTQQVQQITNCTHFSLLFRTYLFFATSCNNCEPDDLEFMTVKVLKDIKIETEIESRTDEALNENIDVGNNRLR